MADTARPEGPRNCGHVVSGAGPPGRRRDEDRDEKNENGG